jgi:hypothetical protein
LLEAKDYMSGTNGDPLKKRAFARMIRGLKGIDGV